MLQLLQKYGHYLVFLVLEGICLYLIVNYNQTQRSIFVHSSSQITGSILEQTARWDEYFYLKNENQKLHKENADLVREVLALNERLNSIDQKITTYDTAQMEVIPLKVIKQDILSLRNHLTLNKGGTSGIKTTMGLVNDDGVVGIIDHVSNNYSTAISMLNVDVAISASIKSLNYFGTVSWRGGNTNTLVLSGIPKHAEVSPGDTVITNGYSTIFPSGIPVGTVVEGQLDKTDQYYEFVIKPLVNYSNIKGAYAIQIRNKQERIDIESYE